MDKQNTKRAALAWTARGGCPYEFMQELAAT